MPSTSTSSNVEVLLSHIEFRCIELELKGRLGIAGGGVEVAARSSAGSSDGGMVDEEVSVSNMFFGMVGTGGAAGAAGTGASSCEWRAM